MHLLPSPLDESALFGRTLFYNHELTLLLFEILLFSAVDLAAQDFVLATIVTFVAQKVNGFAVPDLQRKARE